MMPYFARPLPKQTATVFVPTATQQHLSWLLLVLCQTGLGFWFLSRAILWLTARYSPVFANYPLLALPVAVVCVCMAFRASVAICYVLQNYLRRWLPPQSETPLDNYDSLRYFLFFGTFLLFMIVAAMLCGLK